MNAGIRARAQRRADFPATTTSVGIGWHVGSAGALSIMQSRITPINCTFQDFAEHGGMGGKTWEENAEIPPQYFGLIYPPASVFPDYFPMPSLPIVCVLLQGFLMLGLMIAM